MRKITEKFRRFGQKFGMFIESALGIHAQSVLSVVDGSHKSFAAHKNPSTDDTKHHGIVWRKRRSRMTSRAAIVAVLAVAGLCSAPVAQAALPFDKYTISRDELPEEARKTLSEHFPKAKVSMIKVDRHLLKKTDYDVKLTNGTKIEFSNSGKWTSVDCKKKAVPEAMIPSYIVKKISKEFPKVKIVSLRKKSGAHEVGLSNGKKVKFTALGKYKGEITEAEANAADDTEADTDSSEETASPEE